MPLSDTTIRNKKPGEKPLSSLTAAKSRSATDWREAVAREWIAEKQRGWTPYYLRQVERFLESDVFPYVGNLPIRNVTAAH